MKTIHEVSETLHYNDSIRLIYNETNPKLRYQTSHKKPDGNWTQPVIIQGVSSILNLIPKPYLVSWAALVATEKAVELLTQDLIEDISIFIDKYCKTYNCTPYEAIKAARKQFPVLSQISTGHTAKSDEAKDTGTDAHNALEAHVLGQPYTPTTPGGKNALESFLKGLIEIKNPVTEQAILSRQHNYAGRFDIYCQIGGKNILADWKTNKRDKRFNPSGAHMENFLQMGLYAQAWAEEHGEWPDDLAVINVDKENGEPAIITFASDFDKSPQELASLGISMKYVADSINQFNSAWKEARL